MKNIAGFAFVVSSLALSPLSTFAQGFTKATCEQKYSYLGGYSLEVQALDATLTGLNVTISHHHGPDGDGRDEAPRTESALINTAESSHGAYAYDLPTGTLTFKPASKTGVFKIARDTFELDCTFTLESLVPDTAIRNCANELNVSQKVQTRTTQGEFNRGFSQAAYTEERPIAASIVLETKQTVYFYSETSDISASLYACDKATSTVKELFQSHSISCADLPAVKRSDVLYSDCKL